VRVANSANDKIDFETLNKARTVSAHVLMIPKSRHEAEIVVATNARKVGIAGVSSQED
jgi:hypothetical protein